MKVTAQGALCHVCRRIRKDFSRLPRTCDDCAYRGLYASLSRS